ncbi:hypothetical protein C8F04DRAFT_1192620 [Mycena alexandri]|uniref:Uncharacterized protein n=1 Tax=Mycena alexandri TaxID=1745969 RepID=A0AAD6SC12_9AGAR|nr:hypothetical protein C8F04DRAFT_1192620 [Mycena alexandri]
MLRVAKGRAVGLKYTERERYARGRSAREVYEDGERVAQAPREWRKAKREKKRDGGQARQPWRGLGDRKLGQNPLRNKTNAVKEKPQRSKDESRKMKQDEDQKRPSHTPIHREQARKASSDAAIDTKRGEHQQDPDSLPQKRKPRKYQGEEQKNVRRKKEALRPRDRLCSDKMRRSNDPDEEKRKRDCAGHITPMLENSSAMRTLHLHQPGRIHIIIGDSEKENRVCITVESADKGHPQADKDIQTKN